MKVSGELSKLVPDRYCTQGIAHYSPEVATVVACVVAWRYGGGGGRAFAEALAYILWT